MSSNVPSAVSRSPLSDSTTREGAARWVGSWAAGRQRTEIGNLPPPPGVAGNTLRQVVFATLAGKRVRVLFSNEWGEALLEIRSARLAASRGSAQIDPLNDVGLTFDGNATAVISPGQTLFSDACEFNLEALSTVAITMHFGKTPSVVTGHPGSRTTSYLREGDATTLAAWTQPVSVDHWYFIAGIDVEAESANAVVTLGDSITDGRGSTTNGNDRWPDHLARRLVANRSTHNVAVLNLGIGGNAVLRGGLGPTALERFERDVLGQRGVRWLVVLEGVNDIGESRDDRVAAELVAAYRRFIDAAHARGILAYGVPILPFGGSDYDSACHEAVRQTVNEWIRASGNFDAVLDLDVAVRDPGNPRMLLPAYDCGDHLHLSPAGYQAMANAIDLELFSVRSAHDP